VPRREWRAGDPASSAIPGVRDLRAYTVVLQNNPGVPGARSTRARNWVMPPSAAAYPVLQPQAGTMPCPVRRRLGLGTRREHCSPGVARCVRGRAAPSPPPRPRPNKASTQRSDRPKRVGGRVVVGGEGNEAPVLVGEGGSWDKDRTFAAREKGRQARASSRILRLQPVGAVRCPAGRGSGARAWRESFEVAKVACTARCGGDGRRATADCLSWRRQRGKKPREAGVGGGAGSTNLNRFRLPLRPREAGVGRRGPSPPARPGRHSPPFFCQRLSQGARTYGDCAAFLPSGGKTRSVKEERAKRRTPPRRAQHSVPRPGAGTPPPPPALSRSCGVCQCERERGHPLPRTPRHF
jgi:hypothetical protein